MGRTEKSQGLAPPAIRKDIRAKQARHIVNKVIPAILASNARARFGAENSELISDPNPYQASESLKSNRKLEGGEYNDMTYVKRKGQGRRKAKDTNLTEEQDYRGKAKKSRKRRENSIDEDMLNLTLDYKPESPTPPSKKRTVRIITADTLTAIQILSPPTAKSSKKHPNICILNMASPLRPGGGVLAGATSQEEFLCARTTLLYSLKESFYRLPEFGGIFTPDVLVFRSPSSLGKSAGELSIGGRYYIDVISAAMLRFPDLDGGEDEVKRLARNDRETVEKKMRAVLRIAEAKGVRKIVLGAWGCGAYGNPVADVAVAWRRVLSGASAGRKKSNIVEGEMWSELEDVVFAIPNAKMAADFAREFGGGVEVETVPRSFDEDDEEDDEDGVAIELRTKIEEMEGQISKVYNADLRLRLGVILDGLKAQLKERQDTDSGSDGGVAGSGQDESELDEHDDPIAGIHEGSNEYAEESGTGSSDVEEGIPIES